MCGLPPADTRLLSCCSMANLLGDIWLPEGKVNWLPLLQRPDVCLYLYGKKDARPKRKMGHFTVLSSQSADIAFMLAHKLQRQLQRKGN